MSGKLLVTVWAEISLLGDAIHYSSSSEDHLEVRLFQPQGGLDMHSALWAGHAPCTWKPVVLRKALASET